VIGTFRYDDGGRLAGEWVQTDYRSLLTKLGVTTTETGTKVDANPPATVGTDAGQPEPGDVAAQTHNLTYPLVTAERRYA
jgi:hypothetical protein